MRFSTLSLFVCISVHLLGPVVGLVDSAIAAGAINVDGQLTESRWSASTVTRTRFAYGWLMAYRDRDTVNVGLDVTNDTYDDGPGNLVYPPKGDRFVLIVDSNGNDRIDVDDFAYAPAANSLTNVVRYTCQICRPQDMKFAATGARMAGAFGPSVNSPGAHRSWEIAIPIRELPPGYSPRVWGTESFTDAKGRTATAAAAEAVAADPPAPPPGVKTFLEAHDQDLLDLLQLLVSGDQASVGNYLQSEQGLSLYGQIRKRMDAINFIMRAH